MSNYISYDNFPDILKGLPVKTLLRFRSVCRGWKEIIDSPSFVQDHLSMQQNPQLLVKYDEPELLVLDPETLPLFDTLSFPLSFRLVGTLHGVICLYNNIIEKFQLWNPSIRKFFILHLAGEFGLGDPSAYSYFGFWIDSSGKNFKIIVFTLGLDDVDNELVHFVEGYIYSSIEQAWVPLPVFKLNVYSYRPFPEGPPVMIDGVAHWRAFTEWIDEEGEEMLGTIILSFNFEVESFDVIELPHIDNYYDQFTPVHYKLLDKLAVVCWGLEEGARCEVHVRRAKWNKVFALDLSLAPFYRVLWVTGETEETCRVLAETPEELVIFDADDISSRTSVKSGLRNPENMFVAHEFVESLVFPDI